MVLLRLASNVCPFFPDLSLLSGERFLLARGSPPEADRGDNRLVWTRFVWRHAQWWWCQSLPFAKKLGVSSLIFSLLSSSFGAVCFGDLVKGGCNWTEWATYLRIDHNLTFDFFTCLWVGARHAHTPEPELFCLMVACRSVFVARSFHGSFPCAAIVLPFDVKTIVDPRYLKKKCVRSKTFLKQRRTHVLSHTPTPSTSNSSASVCCSTGQFSVCYT